MQEYYPNLYNESQQFPQQPTSDDLYASQIQEDKIKNIIAQISPETQLTEIEMRIRGYKRNNYTGEWEKINPNIEEPNAVLITNFISYLSSILNQNTSLSNLSAQQINRIMKLVIEYLTDDLDANADEYKLEERYTERTRIGHIVLNSCFFVLNRALNGQEARRMWGALKVMESFSDHPSQKKGGDWWKFWKS